MTLVPFSQSKIAKDLASYRLPRYEELTPFPIVMRQLVTLLDNYLDIFAVPGEEKLITQAMINSYVRTKVIAPPNNKEYSRVHLMQLIVLGILKQVLSINEVGQILELQIKQYPFDIAYNYFCEEMEEALKVTFATRHFAELKHKPTVVTPLTESIRSAVLAFANRIYAKQSIYFTVNNQ